MSNSMNLRSNCKGHCETPNYRQGHVHCRHHHHHLHNRNHSQIGFSDAADIDMITDDIDYTENPLPLANISPFARPGFCINLNMLFSRYWLYFLFTLMLLSIIALAFLFFPVVDRNNTVLRIAKKSYGDVVSLFQNIRNSVRFGLYDKFSSTNDSSTEKLNEFVDSLENRLRILEEQFLAKRLESEIIDKSITALTNGQLDVEGRLKAYNDIINENLKFLQAYVIQVQSDQMNMNEKLAELSPLSNIERQRLSFYNEQVDNLTNFNCSACVTTLDLTSSNNFPTKYDVETLIKSAIEIYDADKTGLADYALETAGGSILSTRCTETYSVSSRTFVFWSIPLFYHRYSPRTVISHGMSPGECWAFKGSQGYLTIKLAGVIQISAVSYEHIPKSVAPDGHINSAPKQFEVYGLMTENDDRALFLGRFTYDKDGKPLQFFTIQAVAHPVPIVELKILNNYGSLEYTCLYRFRVHGKRI